MKPLKEHLLWGVSCGFFFPILHTSVGHPLLQVQIFFLLFVFELFCVLVPGPAEPRLQAHGFFPKCCCERSWSNAGVHPAGIDIPGMFPHPPAGFRNSWSRLIIAGSVSGKGSLAGRERAAWGTDLGLVTFEFC